jgi:beta-glucosidase
VSATSGKPQSTSHFPASFLWGVSTAAYQVEGGNHNNQWAEWEARGGIKSQDQCGQACDWWGNAERDFDLAQQLNLNALRLSVEWSRVEPQEGEFDDEALARYREMLLGLRCRGIEPIVCLHHFTEPLWFQRKGGFRSSSALLLFERFAKRVVHALGDLCHRWITLNEPNVLAALGYVLGEFPPGHRGEFVAALRFTAALARAHARCYYAIHEVQPEAQVGWAHHYTVFQPENPRSLRDRLMARILNELFNESFLTMLDPRAVLSPWSWLSARNPKVRDSFDFVGLNVYSRFHVAFDAKLPAQLFARVYVPPAVPQGDHGVEQPYGEAYPEGIRIAVERAAKLQKPIYILENGVPDDDDRIRPWLISRAVQELDGLLRRNFDVRGYFHWTLTDNFEWSEGWKLRFGLASLNRETQERTLRPSASLYARIAASNGALPELMGSALPEGETLLQEAEDDTVPTFEPAAGLPYASDCQ